MKVIVTGASGMLGYHIVSILSQRNYQTKIFCRNSLPEHFKSFSNIEIVKGDILNKESLLNAVKDCDVIIHAAGDTTLIPSFSITQHLINVTGTANVIEVMKTAKIKRLIYVSSASVFKHGTKDKPGTEDFLLSSSKGQPGYIVTKLEAHKLVLNAIKNDGVPAVIINPCFMIGSNDTKPGSGSVIIEFCKGNIPFFTNGGKNIIRVNDAAIGICNALIKGRLGESYLLGNRNLSFIEFFGLIKEYTKVSPPKFRLPSVFVKIYGIWGSFMENRFSFKLKLNYPMAKIACEGHYYSSAKAIKELDLPQTNIETAIKESVDWFRKNGYLNKS